ncbi:MAG: ribosome silencing factor [Flavobacteriales bacterium]|nr:ribosome silencing factor [Flavobacteriales bacterium]
MHIEKENENLIETIIEGIEDVKGENITLIDLSEIENSITNYFIVCSANSTTQVKAIAGSVERKVRKETKEHPWHVEGIGNNQWILIDYVSVVVHVFLEEYREFYDLEGLWGDAKVTVIDNHNG